ncbi:MAG: phytanoyl-CoA dioxygenase family protein [Anaerolineales bacterium]|nr:phytanoyl-CoA dioxygenase family protein [Anaerolineales bacterium]
MITLDQVDGLVTDAVRQEYWERGYWISPKLMDDDQIARLRAAHDRLWARDYDHDIPSQYGVPNPDLSTLVVRQFLNAFWVNDEIRAAVTSPVTGKIAARLMGVDSVRLWHDQAIYKPGTAGQTTTNVGNIGWHQDYGYWQAASTTNMCTAWVALQDTDLSNGGMRTIVGSHRWGLIEESDSFGVKDLEALAAKFSQAGAHAWLDEPCVLKAGQASFHHSLTFHGSGPNRSAAPRLSVISHMMPGDTTYRAGKQWHPNNVFLGPRAYDGQPFVGDYWPQLWPAAD